MNGAGDLTAGILNHPRVNQAGQRRAVRDNGRFPLVSVIVVAFRDRDELAALIDNISPFRGSDLELVIVDGGSEDGTIELLHARDKEVDYWVSERDEGIYEAMNKGLGAASGKYILHLNAGDRLRTLPFEELRKCSADGIDVACFRVMEDGNQVFTPRSQWLLRLYNTWHHQGTFYRRTAHLGYDERFRVFGDFEHNQRMLKAAKSVRRHVTIVSEHRRGGISAEIGMRHEIYQGIRAHFGFGFLILAYIRFALSDFKEWFLKFGASA